MNILVTGGAGFIGSHLVRKLQEQNHNIVIFDNLSTGKVKNIPNNIKLIKGDVSSQQDIDRLDKFGHKFDAVYHLAGLLDVVGSFKDPSLWTEVNVVGTSNMLEFCKKNNIKKFIYASSCCSTQPFSSPYALTKYLPEYYCRLYKELFEIDTISVRFYNVYGEHMPTSGFRLVISIFLEQFRKNLPLTIIGDGEQTRDYIYAGDIAEGLFKCLNYKGDNSVFNFGTGNSISINEIISMFGNPKTINLPDRGEPKHMVPADISVVKKELNWNPKTNMKSWIQNIIKK